MRLPIGYFGASTGAGAALVATAGDRRIFAVVSRGVRPDLADDALEQVRAPTLLIVGGREYQVLELNREAQRRLKTESELVIVHGATHLFEEPGALGEVVGYVVDLSQGGSAAPRYHQSNKSRRLDVHILLIVDLHLRCSRRSGGCESVHAPTENCLRGDSSEVAERPRLAAKALS